VVGRDGSSHYDHETPNELLKKARKYSLEAAKKAENLKEQQKAFYEQNKAAWAELKESLKPLDLSEYAALTNTREG
jgi:hypothetical protein